MEFLSDPGYLRLAGAAFGLALLLGFTCVSQGTIGRNYALQTLLALGGIALLVLVFEYHGWIAGLVSFFAAWTIMGVSGRVQMHLYEKSTGYGHADRSCRDKATVFVAAFREAKNQLGSDDHNAHIYAQAKAGDYFPMPPEHVVNPPPE